jgi:hypothetical protein
VLGCYNEVMRRRRVLVPVLAVLAATVGCGGEDEPVAVPDGRVAPAAEAPTTTGAATVTSTMVPPLEVAEQVFAALASRDADTIGAVASLTVPGSPAAVIVGHQSQVAALLDEFAAAATSSTTVAAPSIDVASTTTSTTTTTATAVPVVTTPDGVGSVCVTEFECTVFASPEFDAVGLLRSFSVDGVALDEVLRSAGPVVVADGLAVQLRVASAYRTAAGRVSVLVEVVNQSEVAVSPFAFAAVHRHRTVADGSNGLVEAEGAWGPASVPAGGSGRSLIVFGAGPVDGEVLVSVVTDDGLDLEFVLPLLSP